MSSDLESNLHQNNLNGVKYSNSKIYGFEDFRLDVGHLMLYNHGKEVSLTPKQAETLLALIEQAGEIVSKNSLMNRLWGDAAVEESNLIQNIYILRKVLGDTNDGKPMIETLRRRGYRFNADVTDHKHRLPKVSAQLHLAELAMTGIDEFKPNFSGSDEDSIEVEKPAYAYHAWRVAGFLTLSLGILAVAIWMIVSWRQSGSQGNEAASSILSKNFRTKRLSTDGGIYHAVLSPNGKNVYYIRVLGTRQSIRVRHLETDAESELIGGIDAFFGGLDISPDGNSLYFTRKFKANSLLELFLVPTSGGIPVRIAGGLQGSTSVSPDGSLIAYVRCPNSEDSHCSLFVSDSATGENERLLFSTAAGLRITDSVFSADGKSVIYATGQSLTAANEFRLRKIDSVTGQDEAFSTESFFIIKHLARVADSNNILFTASRGSSDATRLWTADVATGNMSSIEKLEGYPNTNSIDKSASRMTATVVDPDFRLETYDLSQGSIGTFLGSAESAVFSPDGRVVFSSPMSGQMDLWVSEPDGSNLRQLTSDSSDERGIAVSHDGSRIYFSSNRSGKLHVWAMNKDGTNPRQLTNEIGGYPIAVSPNDGSVFYKSHIDDTVRRVSEDGSKGEPVISNFLWYPFALSADAGLIAHLEKSDSALNISLTDLTGTKLRNLRLGIDKGNIKALQWSADAGSIYFLHTGLAEGRGAIYKIPADGNAAEKLLDVNLGHFVLGQGFAVSNDGQRFAISSGKWKHDLVLIDFYD